MPVMISSTVGMVTTPSSVVMMTISSMVGTVTTPSTVMPATTPS
jgi:hypothetical protein